MVRLFHYLRSYTCAVLTIMLLLLIQAACDLMLPQYTSAIVDIGIQQGGIEHSVPDLIRAQSMADLELFMTDEELQTVRGAYQTDDSGNLLLLSNLRNKVDLEKLENIFAGPMIAVADLTSKGNTVMALREALERGEVRREDLRNEMQNTMASLRAQGNAVISQKANLYLQGEYEKLGMDLRGIQNSYMLRTGAKMLGMTLIMIAAAVLAGYFASRTAASIGMNLRGRIFDKVVAFSNEELDRFSAASLITRTTNDIQQVQIAMVLLLRMVFYAPLLGVGGILKVAGTKTGLGWIIGVGVGLILLVVSILMKLAMPRFRKMQTLVDRLNLVSREILTGIPVIRAFSREKFEEQRFAEANRDLMSTQLFTSRVMTFMMPMMMLIMNGLTVLIVWNGSLGADRGNLRVGDMMAFISYTMMIVMSFLMLSMISIMLPRAGVAAGRINEVLDTKPLLVDSEHAIAVNRENCKGVLCFEDVAFRYPGADAPALSHISFTAKPGETTAIIGSTGSGKSTLIQLIPRFYDVTEGRITLDGVDLRELAQEGLRSILGYVPQKPLLFSGDIASNLKFGGEWITDESMRLAAEIAQATEFIEGKEQGYQSSIAQGGSNVSGGQKQRLSIARAIARNPKIYLFDDSFSALDYKTDVALRRALTQQVKDATVLIVAQRISTILHADRILVLDEGRIAGAGTHAELLRTCKEYQEIARSQLSEEELERGRAG